jgi:PEP-CTERM/exosortase A-associated glycosyltransferase
MAVLHVAQYSLPEVQSGYTIRTQAIVSQEKRLGMAPLVVTSPSHPSAQEQELDGVMHYRCRPEREGQSAWLRDARRVRALAARIQQIAQDRGDVRLLHAHSPVLCGMAALRAGRRLGLPVVYEVRGLWEEAMRGRGRWALRWPRYCLARWMETRVCRSADAVVAISDGLRTEFVSRGVGDEQVDVIPNGVDTELFSPQPPSASWKADHGIPEGPLILYLGALRRYEGIELLLDAFPRILAHRPDAQLLIVGDGEARHTIEQRLAGGSDHIRLLAAVPHLRTREIYAAADVVVYPRLSDRATERVTPLKPLEAMAMGKAIVASDVGGLRELLTDGETARLFPAGFAGALAAACIELLADAAARVRLGQRAREVACGDFDWGAIAGEYRRVYQAAGLVSDGA